MPDDQTKKPWGSDEDFDAEKAWNLIQNLRAEKAQLQTDKQALVTERDTALQTVQKHAAEIEGLQAAAKTERDTLTAEVGSFKGRTAQLAKETLALEAGLPRDFARFIVGDDEEAWKENATALAALRDGGTPRVDPAQSAQGFDDDDALARAFLGI